MTHAHRFQHLLTLCSPVLGAMGVRLPLSSSSVRNAAVATDVSVCGNIPSSLQGPE